MNPSLPSCLVVDADPASAKTLAGIIASHGFSTRVIPEAFAALRDLRTNRYDIILFEVSRATDATFVLETLRRDLPQLLDKVVLVTTTPIMSSTLTAGIPVVGKNDLKPLLRYLGND